MQKANQSSRLESPEDGLRWSRKNNLCTISFLKNKQTRVPELMEERKGQFWPKNRLIITNTVSLQLLDLKD